MPFTFKELEIPGLVLITPKVFFDERGFFTETYKQTDFSDFGIKESFVQENHSSSTQGVLRGLHFQRDPMAQGKVVRVIRGEIFDVAVDIREGSPYYGKWLGVKLSAKDKNMLYVPAGFAHGFCTLSELTEVSYKCTNEYSPEDEGGIIWNDPDLAISWPMASPVLSDKDSKNPLFKDSNINFKYEVKI